MSKLQPLDCLRAVVVMLNDFTIAAPEALSGKLEAAAALVEEAIEQLDGWQPAADSIRKP